MSRDPGRDRTPSHQQRAQEMPTRQPCTPPQPPPAQAPPVKAPQYRHVPPPRSPSARRTVAGRSSGATPPWREHEERRNRVEREERRQRSETPQPRNTRSRTDNRPSQCAYWTNTGRSQREPPPNVHLPHPRTAAAVKDFISNLIGEITHVSLPLYRGRAGGNKTNLSNSTFFAWKPYDSDPPPRMEL
jgi:hypothetical protein